MTSKVLLTGSIACCLIVSTAHAAAEEFKHPGILNGAAQLEFIKAKVAAGEQPWRDALEKAKALPHAALDYKPKPHEEVNCGSGSRPNYGCSDEKRDSQAAYLHALLWAITGDERHARKSAEILHAWRILQSHGMSNANLQAGWTGGPFCRAAEILRHTDGDWKWPKAEQDAFTAMLRRAFIPRVGEPQRPSTNGNWEAVMIETAMSIAVFTDDRALFDKCVDRFRRRLPAYIYGTEDGPVPLTVDSTHYDTREKIDKHWYDQTVLFDGLSQETGRDLTHTQWGMGGLVHCAEIAWNQGIDLYAERDSRLLRGLEFHAKFLNGAPVPKELQGGKLDGGRIAPAWEIAYNHYHGRRGLPMPETEKLLAKHRPELGPDHHLGFGTLSHFGTAKTDDAMRPKRPRITGLSHVALFVKDVEQSRAFYKDFLGYAEPYSVFDEGDKLRLTFIKINDLQAIELFPEREANSDRLNHFALLVDDAEAMRALLAAKGVTVPDKVPRGRIGNSNFTIRDPDGHGVEIVQYEPDGWTVREKGKHLPDTRIAPRIRHVGILVGDLERSKKFYGELFGLSETWRGSRDGKLLSWVNMKVPDGDEYIELMLYDQPITPDRRLSAHHVCLELPDVAKAEATLKRRTLPPGCKAMSELRVGRNGKRQINLFDPDGTRVEIMEPTTADGRPVPPSTAPAPAPVPTTQPQELLR